jgi:hypothetical protein
VTFWNRETQAIYGYGRAEAVERVTHEPLATVFPESRQVRACDCVNAYVVKPVEFDAFSEAVEALGLFWLVINEPPPDRQSPG